MKKRYTEQQIAFALRQSETGTPISEITRKMGISEVTFIDGENSIQGFKVRRFDDLNS